LGQSLHSYVKRAKQALSALTFQKLASIRVVDIDRYNRTVGRIYVGDLDVSAEMVRLGAAWVYRKYAEDQNLYRREDGAKEAKRGL
jgi:micrococcal nuclease